MEETNHISYEGTLYFLLPFTFVIQQVSVYMLLPFFLIKLPLDQLIMIPSFCFQVHLIDLKVNGNYSLVRWAVFPAESSDYFSNTTAMVNLLFIVGIYELENEVVVHLLVNVQSNVEFIHRV